MADPISTQDTQEEMKALGVLLSREPVNSQMLILRRILACKTMFPNICAARHFDFDYFNSLSEVDKAGLLEIITAGLHNPTEAIMGCYATNTHDYERFRPFFSKVIADYHKVPMDAKHTDPSWSLDGLAGVPPGGKLDLTALGLPPLSMRVRVGRNLADYPLPASMTKNDRINLEVKMTEAFKLLIKRTDFGGGYHSLTPGHPSQITNEKYQELVDGHIMFKDMSKSEFLASAGFADDWPYGRGCYISGDCQVIVWVGEEDQLRIMSMKKGTELTDVFNRLRVVLDTIESLPGVKFSTVPGFGHITSCPTNLGTGMRASVHVQVPFLTHDGSETKVKAIAKPLGLSVRGVNGEHTPIGKDGTIDISPSARFCITEANIILALYQGLCRLWEEEKKAERCYGRKAN